MHSNEQNLRRAVKRANKVIRGWRRQIKLLKAKLEQKVRALNLVLETIRRMPTRAEKLLQNR